MKSLLFIIIPFLTLSAFSAHAQTDTSQHEVEVTEVIWKGKTYRKGDRVRIILRSGTMKPVETGYSQEVEADPGKTGTIICGKKRSMVASYYYKPDPNEPIQIVLVKWDPQVWKTYKNGQDVMIDLRSFQSTIHVEYLEVIPK